MIEKFGLIAVFAILFSVSYSYAQESAPDVVIPFGAQDPNFSNFYDPKVLTVMEGSKVTWKNLDTIRHSITSGSNADSSDGLFDSGLLGFTQTYAYRFLEKGTFDYHCSVHPWMSGTVIVTDNPNSVSENIHDLSILADDNSVQKCYDATSLCQAIGIRGTSSSTSLTFTVELNGKIIEESKITVNPGGWYQRGIGTLNMDPGIYKFTVSDGTQLKSVTVELIGNKSNQEIASNVNSFEETIIPKTLEPTYDIEGAKVLQMFLDEDIFSLVISIDAYDNGSISIDIPRDYLDSKDGQNDADYFVILDGDKVNFDETVTDHSRTLTIPFVRNSEEIEIFGTKTMNGSLQSEPESEIEIENVSTAPPPKTDKVPSWIKNNAKWWSENQIDDNTFTNGIRFLITEKIVNIPTLSSQASEITQEKVPVWIKNNAKWWSEGLISEDDFVKGIEFLVSGGIIQVTDDTKFKENPNQIGYDLHKIDFEKIKKDLENRAKGHPANVTINFLKSETNQDTTTYYYKINWLYWDSIAMYEGKRCDTYQFEERITCIFKGDTVYDKIEKIDDGSLEFTYDESGIKKVKIFLKYAEEEDNIPTWVAKIHDSVIQVYSTDLYNDSKYLFWITTASVENPFVDSRQFGNMKVSVNTDEKTHFQYLIEFN